MNSLHYPLYFVLALQALDILTTYLCITSGKGAEGNKFLARIFDKIGLLPGLLLVKGVLVVWLWFVYPLLPVEVLYVLGAGYVWVVYNNVKVLNR